MTTKFIAEIGSNHNGSFERACDLIAAAADIGCDGVKFQLFQVDRLFSIEALASRPELQARRALEIPCDWLPNLALVAKQHGLLFGCTPFDISSIAALHALVPQVDFIKVSSYSLLHGELLSACALSQKQLLVSTGMATTGELVRAWQHHLKLAKASRITLLHCVSQYPVPADRCGLDRIDELRTLFGDCPVGWSDHSADPAVVLRAAHHYDAAVIECHLDLRDRQGSEWSGGHCWTPGRLMDAIAQVRRGASADRYVPHADDSERAWRADPVDGLRPLRTARGALDARTENK